MNWILTGDLSREVEFASSPLPVPSDNLHRIFSAQARLTPDAIAVVAADGELTYELLDKKANRLARLMRESGVALESFVGIALERSLDMAVAILAVLKAGGAYVPLDVNYPHDRIAYMVDDANMHLVLTRRFFADRLGAGLCRMIFMDSVDLDGYSDEPLTDETTPDHLAYCIYTSGSTGRPKGVLITHRSASNTLRWIARHCGLASTDRIFSICAFSFDFSVSEFWPAFFVGARTVLSSPDAPNDPNLLFCELAAHQITVLQIVPSLLSVLLLKPNLAAMASLRHVISGGEALPGSLRDRFHEICAAQLHNFYGPTETAVWATGAVVGRDDASSTVNIGRPIDNVSIQILDEFRNQIPPGQIGEIYIGGAGVARGYLGRPDLTDEGFIPDPFGAPGARLYRTGDLGRWRDDGAIDYLGRADQQIKLRGLRIELGEIETQISQNFPVGDVAVVATSGSSAEQKLVAYVVPDSKVEGSVLLPDQVKERLKTTLPAHMVPSHIVVIEKMPLTPNGKLDRKSLSERKVEIARADRTPLKLLSATESRVTALMAEILGEPVNLHDDFFQLAGSSLQALKLTALIESEFHRRIPISALYVNPTAQALAALIDETTVDEEWSCLVPLNQGGQGAPLFCLHGFEGNVYNYLHLAHRLNKKVSLLGLRVNPDWRQSHVQSIDALAEIFEKEVREAQPHGPYRIAGYSFGGVPAFEVACRLERAGEKVTLILLDANPHTYAIKALSWYPRFVKMILARDVIGTIKRKLNDFLSYELYYWRTGVDRDVDHGLKRAALRVKHGKFSGKVVLFRSTSFDDERAYRLALDGVNGWKDFVERAIQVVDIECGHVNLMHEPAISSVAAQLSQAFD